MNRLLSELAQFGLLQRSCDRLDCFVHAAYTRIGFWQTLGSTPWGARTTIKPPKSPGYRVNRLVPGGATRRDATFIATSYALRSCESWLLRDNAELSISAGSGESLPLP